LRALQSMRLCARAEPAASAKDRRRSPR